jgi:hypothetical protein
MRIDFQTASSLDRRQPFVRRNICSLLFDAHKSDSKFSCTSIRWFVPIDCNVTAETQQAEKDINSRTETHVDLWKIPVSCADEGIDGKQQVFIIT